MPNRVRLQVTQGPVKDQEFVFEEHDLVLFGRAPDCHICLPLQDNTASRHHFALEVNPPDARVRDLGSLNGTYVNGEKIGAREQHETPEQAAQRQYRQVDLRDGDEIGVGQTVLRVGVEVAIQCNQCGAEAPDEAREAQARANGTYLCATCREKNEAAARAKAPVKPPEPVRCQQCGRQAPAEIGLAQRGIYVCDACRRKGEADPLAVLLALLKQPRQQPEPGPQIPDYEIERKLGEGGMGAVYLARHRVRGNRVALKVLLSKVAVTEDSRKRFIREIESTRALRHPNVVEFYDQGSAGGVFYFLLEYCQGGSLEDLRQTRGGRMPLAEAGAFMLQALDGLAYVHQRGFVHRDLKPHNILLNNGNGQWTAKIADLGLARNFERAGFSGLTATGSYAGSYPFMPREQLTNFKYFKPVSDVWAMGATLYYLLTGQVPYNFQPKQDPVAVILKGAVVPIRRRITRLPGRVADVIDRALAIDVKHRYQDAGELRRALEKAL